MQRTKEQVRDDLNNIALKYGFTNITWVMQKVEACESGTFGNWNGYHKEKLIAIYEREIKKLKQ